jgi:isopenicillin N synthase-like dioxygenase
MAELKLTEKLAFCNAIHTYGYAVVDASPTLAAVIRQLSESVVNLFRIDEAEKAKICCEYVSKKNTKDYRDRLELRFDESAQHVVPCLRREQYQGGYELVPTTNFATIIPNTITDSSILNQAFILLRKSAEAIYDILCEHIGICVDDRSQLLQQLRQKDQHGLTDSVLRVLRYPTEENHAIKQKYENQSPVVAGDHTDIGLVTLMPFGSVPTLQILTTKFEWIDIEKFKENFECPVLVIAGEQLAYLSNYYYVPTRHRILKNTSSTDRISCPFLLRYNPQVTIPQFKISFSALNQNNSDGIFEKALPSKHRISASEIKSRIFPYNPHCEWRLNLAFRLFNKLKSVCSHIECVLVSGTTSCNAGLGPKNLHTSLEKTGRRHSVTIILLVVSNLVVILVWILLFVMRVRRAQIP